MEDSSEKESSQSRIRRTFVAGLFAFVPLAATVFIVWYINEKTIGITEWLFNRRIPFLGVVIALAAIYLTGMITTSLLGRILIRMLDAVLIRLPIIRQLYLAWKQIALTPDGTEGTFSRVVLIPDESGARRQMGFTSGRLVKSTPPYYCVFVPSCPNPVNGRLYFVPVDQCQLIEMTPEEGFKIILSTGNYVPPLVEATVSAVITARHT
jgi:uncharacterized membrane protein